LEAPSADMLLKVDNNKLLLKLLPLRLLLLKQALLHSPKPHPPPRMLRFLKVKTQSL